MDFAGPLDVRDHPGKKFHFLLFACGVIRAIHLELTSALSAQEAQLAFKRFAARRGMLRIIYSARARSFVRLSELLLNELGPAAPKWIFNPPRAPWWGGCWECLVRSVKLHLKKSVGMKILDQTELETCLCEIEAILNSRPLTFVADGSDSVQPLMPSHFLLGRTMTEYVLPSETTPTPGELRDIRSLMNERRWSAEYLRNLPTGARKVGSTRELREGSVVLIQEDQLPHLRWKIGRVTEVYPGSDGLVRCANVRTAHGEILRAIQRLHTLEVEVEPLNSEEEPVREVLGDAPADPQSISGRPATRSASVAQVGFRSPHLGWIYNCI